MVISALVSAPHVSSKASARDCAVALVYHHTSAEQVSSVNSQLLVWCSKRIANCHLKVKCSFHRCPKVNFLRVEAQPEKDFFRIDLEVFGVALPMPHILELLSEQHVPKASKACTFIEVLSSDIFPVCGNSVCEFGEMDGLPGFKDSSLICRQDCPVTLTPCPHASPFSPVARKDICAGNGRCLFTSGGFCSCFEGYTGVACDACAHNWVPIDGACFPEHEKEVISNQAMQTPQVTSELCVLLQWFPLDPSTKK